MKQMVGLERLAGDVCVVGGADPEGARAVAPDSHIEVCHLEVCAKELPSFVVNRDCLDGILNAPSHGQRLEFSP